MLGNKPKLRHYRKQPARFEELVREVFGDHKHCYGTRRLRAELQAWGQRVGRLRTAAPTWATMPAELIAAALRRALLARYLAADRLV